jgi:hypothetical protein
VGFASPPYLGAGIAFAAMANAVFWLVVADSFGNNGRRR